MSWISIIPPLLAIFLAIRTKQVYLSLMLGIWMGLTAFHGWNPLLGTKATLSQFVDIFKDSGNTRVILFCIMVGGLISLTQKSGGVSGFINLMTESRLVKNKKSAQLLAWATGLIIFIETSLICLIVGSIGRPLFDKFKISREKLAYIADSTAAPICVMIPFNGWGAYITVLLAEQGIERPFYTLAQAIPTNFYAIFTMMFVLFIILSGKDFFTMKKAENRVRDTGKVIRDDATPLVDEETINVKPKENVVHKARNLLAPLVVLIVMLPVGMLVTGEGNIANGSGSTSVYWAVFSAVFTAIILYRVQGIFTIRESIDSFIHGMGGLISMGILMIMAFSLGNTCKLLQTGPYVAGLVQNTNLPDFLIIPAVFMISCFIAFSTGTSWGTFAIMIPIAVPLASSVGLNLPMMVSAVMGGGVFGDHCSPISDTTIISSMASASDHIDHVRTQLPYAVITGSAAFAFYIVFSFIFG